MMCTFLGLAACQYDILLYYIILYHTLGAPPHPVIVAIRDNKDLLGSSYIPIIPLLQGGGSS